MDITYEEIELMREGYCEGCKGVFWMHETGCYEHCDGFQREIEELQKEK